MSGEAYNANKSDLRHDRSRRHTCIQNKDTDHTVNGIKHHEATGICNWIYSARAKYSQSEPRTLYTALTNPELKQRTWRGRIQITRVPFL